MLFIIFMVQKESNIPSTELRKAMKIFCYLFITWNSYTIRNKNFLNLVKAIYINHINHLSLWISLINSKALLRQGCSVSLSLFNMIRSPG